MDKIEVEILEDGTLKISTDEVSAANHLSAEKLLTHLSQLAGGQSTRTGKGHVHDNSHSHEHLKH